MPRRDDPEHNAEDDAAAVDDVLADADGLSHAIGNCLHDAIARVGHEPLVQVHRCAHARERDAEQQAQRLLPKLGRVGQQRAEHVEEARDRKRQRNLQKVDGAERTSLEHVLDQRDDDVGDHRRIAEVEAADNRDDVGNRDNRRYPHQRLGVEYDAHRQDDHPAHVEHPAKHDLRPRPLCLSVHNWIVVIPFFAQLADTCRSRLLQYI